MACLAAGAFVFGVSGAVNAQAAVPAASDVPPRVVIAPPADDLARTIKADLSAAYYGAKPDSRGYADAQKLYYFYGARGFEPLWIVKGADGKVSFSPNAEKIIDVFKDATAEGFRPSDYLTPNLDVNAAGSDPAKLAALETAFSASTLRYAQNAYGGRIAPASVSSYLAIAPHRLDASDTLLKLASSQTPDQVLHDLDPKDREFVALKAELAKLNGNTAADAVVVPDGPLLKAGMTDDRVAILRKRLDVAAPADATAETALIYDPALVDAVKAFQTSLGLTADGHIGPATVAALNGSSGISKDDVIANMERWRWMPSDIGTFHVLVNIPEFRLYVVDNDAVTYTTRVVVGKPTTQTPIFSDQIEDIVVNPYWNVPASIVNNEIAPKLASNPGYLASQNMELLSGAKVINASAIDWSTVTPGKFPFAVRQKPGASNALGAIKFIFPNPMDIYLHDTPSKSLFVRDFRAFSHGCVRVQNPMDFADALLKAEPNLDSAKLKAMAGPTEKWVPLKNHVPVHLAYFTLRVDPDGTIRSFGDVYGHNKKLIKLLDE
jgi:murein L,D-transpeptidase YcbB/YkuD